MSTTRKKSTPTAATPAVASPTPGEFVLPSGAKAPAAVSAAPAAVPFAAPSAGTGLQRTQHLPVRRPGTLLVGADPASAGTAVLRHEVEALMQLGGRVLALAESQDRMLGELRASLAGAETELQALEPGAQHRVAARIGELSAILAWCEAIQRDLSTECAGAALVQGPVDLLLLCQDVVHDLGARERPVVVAGSVRHAVVGSIPELAHLLRLAIALVDQRSAGWSDVHLSLGEDEAGPAVRVHGLDGARCEPEAEVVADFRAAVAATGWSVQPDESGPDGTGLVLRAPGAAVGPLLG